MVEEQHESVAENHASLFAKEGGEHTRVHAFVQPPLEGDDMSQKVESPWKINEHPTHLADNLVFKPAFKIYPGMPEEVQKIVEEYNSKGTFLSKFS